VNTDNSVDNDVHRIAERLLVEGDERRSLDEDVASGDDRDDHVDVHEEPIHHQRHVTPVVDHLPNNSTVTM